MQMIACVSSPVCRTPRASPHPLVPGDATILTKNLLYDIRTDTDVTWMVCATESQVERCLRRLGTELREALTTTYVDAESCTDYWRRTSDDGTHRLGDRLILSVAMAWAVYMVGERRLVLRVDRIDPLDAGAFDGLVARHLLRTQVTCRQPEGIVAGVEADRERLGADAGRVRVRAERHAR